jgi:hypothetical protein
MPVNWYAALVVIVLVGLASVAIAKYHYNQTPTVVEPAVGTTWHGAIAFDICGTTQPALSASPSTSTSGLTTTGNGVLLIAPKKASEAGHNATVGKFASEYSGLTLTNTSLKYPGSNSTVYKNGEKCPAGTPDAGKVGEMQARSWLLTTKTGKDGQLEQTKGVTVPHPADLRLLNRQLITVGFVPSGTTLPKPPASTITALLQVLSGSQPVATTTTTAAGATTSSTAVATTSTTAPASTTTSKAATTTTAPTTTTTKPSSTTTTK